MRRLRKVKIVATLGPASNTYEMIRTLHEAGADVFRLNMSHGTHEDITKLHRAIRQVEKDLDSPIAILADLQGPKLRVGEFENGEEELEWGETFRLDLDKAPGTKAAGSTDPRVHLVLVGRLPESFSLQCVIERWLLL